MGDVVVAIATGSAAWRVVVARPVMETMRQPAIRMLFIMSKIIGLRETPLS
jgi:hypothetical protein